MRVRFSCFRWLLKGAPLLFGLLLSGCDQPQAAANADDSATGAEMSATARQPGWPRTLQTPVGPLTLQQPPQRIVSTSVTLSGTLLAINAPLVGSGATSPNTAVADKQGFFRQWSEIARARGVRPLYLSQPNPEAIAAEAPDLILIAATGGDSALRLYDQLAAIAPVLVIDYGNKSWQALTRQLGQITGHEADAQAIIARFDQRVQKVKQQIKLPPQPVSPLVYYEDGRGINLWTPASAQGSLLEALGFTLAQPAADAHAETRMGKRQDIIQLSGENMAAGITGNTLLLFSADDETVRQVLANPFLAHLAPLRNKQVYALGQNSFRLDYYSASEMLDTLEAHFSR